jgi:hypothetical protein
LFFIGWCETQTHTDVSILFQIKPLNHSGQSTFSGFPSPWFTLFTKLTLYSLPPTGREYTLNELLKFLLLNSCPWIQGGLFLSFLSIYLLVLYIYLSFLDVFIFVLVSSSLVLTLYGSAILWYDTPSETNIFLLPICFYVCLDSSMNLSWVPGEPLGGIYIYIWSILRIKQVLHLHLSIWQIDALL